MRRCDAPSQRRAGGGVGPGFHPLVPVATRPALSAAASDAAGAPATAAPAPVHDVHVASKPSRFKALTPAGKQTFAMPGLLSNAPAPVRTGAHLLCPQELGQACAGPSMGEPAGQLAADSDEGGSERTGDDTSAKPQNGPPGDPATPVIRPGGFAPPQRKPFAMALAVTPTSAARSSPAMSLDEPVYIEVFFTKFSKKKKKVWEDGVLVLKQGSMELQRDDGSTVTKCNKKCSKENAPPEIGSMLFLGSFEVTAVLPPSCLRAALSDHGACAVASAASLKQYKHSWRLSSTSPRRNSSRRGWARSHRVA